MRGIEYLREAEVTNKWAAFGIEEDVGRLQVAVNDPEPLECLQRRKLHKEDVDGVSNRKEIKEIDLQVWLRSNDLGIEASSRGPSIRSPVRDPL